MKLTQHSFLIWIMCTSAAYAQSPEVDGALTHGEKIHEDHCYKCHTEQIYSRDNRIAKSINALGKQVQQCKDANNTPWFDEETDAVVHFLNKQYYKF